MNKSVDQDTFWTRMEDIVAGMLHLPARRPFPMSHYVDADAKALWFITARGTALDDALVTGPVENLHYAVASQDGQLYAAIEGRAAIVEDAAKKKEIWNVVADAWFEGGEDDPDAVLVRFDISVAEVWSTTGSLAFLYQIAKAQITDEKPDMGSHDVLRFAA